MATGSITNVSAGTPSALLPDEVSHQGRPRGLACRPSEPDQFSFGSRGWASCETTHGLRWGSGGAMPPSRHRPTGVPSEARGDQAQPPMGREMYRPELRG